MSPHLKNIISKSYNLDLDIVQFCLSYQNCCNLRSSSYMHGEGKINNLHFNSYYFTDFNIHRLLRIKYP
ncbi:hypothetical protein H5410_057669 [Solanum commersonii]|uniref:Uncharacterized protein n=1 Tax=Solanum commersonii TaxID=4109 RepID=A0A9J5WQP3_SOLCO|nr:hypothetical protein H5410_057669 [Solanum commersonii]